MEQQSLTPDAEVLSIWEQILNRLHDSLAGSAFKWINAVKPLAIDEDTMTLGTPNELTQTWIESHYLAILKDAINDVLKSPRQIVWQTVPQPDAPAKQEIEENNAVLKQDHPDMTKMQQGDLFKQPAPPAPEAGYMHIIAPGDKSSLNPKYTFDTFVTGKSNSFAKAAAEAVAKKPGIEYNPLFMYGGVGLGKTHLMHAIGNRVLENDPDKRVLYVSSETFTNEMISAISKNKTQEFREKYRSIDVLMIDDIQFISGKTSTQEEFFHTFNALRDANKQIIISSDRPPKEVKDMEDRLISRFEWGLVADIQSPDLETRIAILKNKAALDHYDVPNDVMLYIASRIKSNIRELEGALTRVVAYASLVKQPITTDLVATALKDIFPDTETKEITMDVIQDVVAAYFKISVADLHAKKRTRQIAFPRQIAMYLCRELTDTSLPQIGNFFGGRDHTTVLHACDKIASESKKDAKLQNIMEELKERLQKV